MAAPRDQKRACSFGWENASSPRACYLESHVKKLLITTVIALVAIFVVAPRFVRWTATHAKTPVGTAAFRLGILQRTLFDSNTVADSNDVVALVMDWNMGGRTTATLAAFADGKTSLYISPGKALTSENRRNVQDAVERFRAVAANRPDYFSTTADFDPPANGKVRFYRITRTGTYATYPQMIDVLQNEGQPLHALLEAGQALAAEMQRQNN